MELRIYLHFFFSESSGVPICLSSGRKIEILTIINNANVSLSHCYVVTLKLLWTIFMKFYTYIFKDIKNIKNDHMLCLLH